MASRKESIVLVRPHEDIAWGFRFAHVRSPQHPEVTRINPHGIASQHMRIGQLILAVNNVSTNGVSVHGIGDLIRQQGNRLALVVQNIGGVIGRSSPDSEHFRHSSSSRPSSRLHHKDEQIQTPDYYYSQHAGRAVSPPVSKTHVVRTNNRPPTDEVRHHHSVRQNNKVYSSATLPMSLSNRSSRQADTHTSYSQSIERVSPTRSERSYSSIYRSQRSPALKVNQASFDSVSRASPVVSNTNSHIPLYVDTGHPTTGRLQRLLQQDEELRHHNVIDDRSSPVNHAKYQEESPVYAHRIVKESSGRPRPVSVSHASTGSSSRMDAPRPGPTVHTSQPSDQVRSTSNNERGVHSNRSPSDEVVEQHVPVRHRVKKLEDGSLKSSADSDWTRHPVSVNRPPVDSSSRLSSSNEFEWQPQSVTRSFTSSSIRSGWRNESADRQRVVQNNRLGEKRPSIGATAERSDF